MSIGQNLFQPIVAKITPEEMDTSLNDPSVQFIFFLSIEYIETKEWAIINIKRCLSLKNQNQVN